MLSGKFYHIYNCGINGCNLFCTEENYAYFLHLYDKHISPIADTYAWVLMPNHFHLLVRIKDHSNLSGFQNLTGLKPPHQYFSNLFNAYTKAFNRRTKRHGPLFERPFKRKVIENQKYLRNVLLYIHNNPVHHGFVENTLDYPWSSYLSCISIKPSRLKRNQVIGWFDNAANFVNAHGEQLDLNEIADIAY